MKSRLLCIFAVLTAMFLLVSCNAGDNTVISDSKMTQEITLYFSNADYNDIQAEKRIVTYDGGDTLAKAVAEELLKGPLETGSKAVIPKDTRLIDIEIDGTTAKLNFSREYFNFEGEHRKSAELLARYSIVKTLCGVDGVNRVDICVEGSELLNASGNPIGAIGEGDIVFNQGSQENVTEKYVVLYFADEMAQNLVSERRKAPLVDNSMEKTIVTELIKGPGSNDLYAVIPSGTKVLSVETKEGICFVNLSGEFVSKSDGGSSSAEMAIYSIVDSLTELPEIEKVQFLVDSEKLDTYDGYIFSDPFERDESLIKK